MSTTETPGGHVGKNRRRGGRRREGASPPSGNRPPAARPAWRRWINAWGGPWLVGSLALVVVVVGALIFLNRPSASVNSALYTPKTRAQVNGTTWGDPNAPVKMIEFADFQCPFCRRFTEETEPTLASEYIKTGKVQLIFHNYAFIGPDSTRAAEAALCAADQGHFWDLHDLLYLRQGQENTGVFSTQHLTEFAQTLHNHFPDFNVTTFSSCLASGQKASQVKSEAAQATAAGVQSTPSFLINGKLVQGALDISAFRSAIDDALATAAATPAPTGTAAATATPTAAH